MSLFQPSDYQYQLMRGPCGCRIYIDNSWKYLPQVSLKAHATILSSVSRTTLTQTFVNPAESILQEVSYRFPLYDGVSVVGFKCQVGSRMLHSEVKAKEQANTDYQNAIKRQEPVAIMDHLDTGDVFKIRLGNVPAKEKVTVDITFVGELKQDAQIDGIRYTLPNSIAPRYGNTWSYSQQQAESSGFRAILDGISITVDILLENSSTIREIQSTSHSPKVSLGRVSTSSPGSNSFEPSQASAALRLHKGNQALLETDFVLVVKADGLENPRALLESHPKFAGQRALMATLVPKFNLPINQPEIVFVIDRSGSMHNKIATLRDALKVFLKSLSPGICFNICSFGSSHSLLWPTSRVYDQHSLNQALEFVNTVSADMGGTEMQDAVRATVQSRLSNKDLEVLILTDGEIWDQNSLFDFVRGSSSGHTARFFSLGIGRSVSHSLIEGISRAGQGFSQSVLENQELDRCVVRMLKGALTPHIYDYKIKVDYEHTVTQDFEIISDSEAYMSDTETEVQNDSAQASPAQAQTISLFSDNYTEPETIPGPEVGPTDQALPEISAPKVIQAPHKIPPLYPFIRTTAYLLLDPEPSNKIPRSLTISATSKQGPLCLRIPIADVGQGETIHQLASHKAVVELEELQGWLSDSKDKSGNPFDQLHQQTKEKLAKHECERLGIKYQVTGKYCSFVALQERDGESSESLELGSIEEVPIQRQQDAPRPRSLMQMQLAQCQMAQRAAVPASAASSQVSKNYARSPQQPYATRYMTARMESPPSYGGGLFGNAPHPSGQVPNMNMHAPAYSGRSIDCMTNSTQDPQVMMFSGSADAFGYGYQSVPAPSGGLSRSTSNNTQGQSSSVFAGAGSPGLSQRQSASFFGSAPSPPQASYKYQGLVDTGLHADRRFVSHVNAGAMNQSAALQTGKINEPIGTPKSKVHALIDMQKFDGSWIWEERLFNTLGCAMDELRTRITCMLQKDGMRGTLTAQEANVITTWMVMGWLNRNHIDTKATWELVYEKANSWAQQEIAQVSSDILDCYGMEFWGDFI